LDYRLLLARRYLVGRRRVTLISFISAVSVAGVAIGVAALIVVLSVMNGFYVVVRDLLVAYDPHVRIEAADARGLANADSLAAVARTVEGVATAAPYIEGQALLTSPDSPGLNLVVTVRGVDPLATGGLEQAVTEGSFDLTAGPAGTGLVMGAMPAARAALTPGAVDAVPDASRVTLLSAPALEVALAQYPLGLPATQVFALRGVYALDPAYDEDHVFVALAEAQRLFRMAGRASGVDLRLADLEDAGGVREELEARLAPSGGDRYRIRTWYDLQAALYGVMRLEKWAASAILAMIVVVAAFNIVGALTMIVIEKQRDLAVLQAMGSARTDVRRIFVLEGLLVGAVGAGLGLVLGLGLAIAQARYGFVKLAGADAFVIDAYPVAIRLLDVIGVTLLAVGLCVAAALYPATRAAAAQPADALRGAG
jgi:lipoprotein-releasing system permease protein